MVIATHSTASSCSLDQNDRIDRPGCYVIALSPRFSLFHFHSIPLFPRSRLIVPRSHPHPIQYSYALTPLPRLTPELLPIIIVLSDRSQAGLLLVRHLPLPLWVSQFYRLLLQLLYPSLLNRWNPTTLPFIGFFSLLFTAVFGRPHLQTYYTTLQLDCSSVFLLHVVS